MALAAGTRLGPYEILSALGAGGMGEVYRARDTRLERLVAIKVLTHALAASLQALERFEREAQVLASLNHPNIAAIYGLERQGGGTGRTGRQTSSSWSWSRDPRSRSDWHGRPGLKTQPYRSRR